MERTRVTYHNARAHANGKVFSPHHNDRDFSLESAENIDAKRTRHNIYWNWIDGWYRHDEREQKHSFYEAERAYYEQTFAPAYAEQQERHKQHRNYDRMKTLDEWIYGVRNNAPVETYLQIGKSGDGNHPSAKVMYDCGKELIGKLQDWSEEHGDCIRLLDVAFHFDEEVPQLHIRRVYQYQDDDDVWRIGQTKALELAGVPYDVEAATQERLKTALSKKRREAVKAREDEEGRRLKSREAADVRKSVELTEDETSSIRNDPQPTRHANRLMTFDAMVRGWWCDICEQHGVEVERTPLPPHKSRSKEKMLWEREKDVRSKEEQIERARQDYEQLLSLNVRNARLLSEGEDALRLLHGDIDEADDELRYLDDAVRKTKDYKQRLDVAVAEKHDKLADLERAADEVRNDTTAHDLLRGFAAFIDKAFPGLARIGYDPVAFVDNFLQDRQRMAQNRRRVLVSPEDAHSDQNAYEGPGS